MQLIEVGTTVRGIAVEDSLVVAGLLEPGAPASEIRIGHQRVQRLQGILSGKGTQSLYETADPPGGAHLECHEPGCFGRRKGAAHQCDESHERWCALLVARGGETYGRVAGAEEGGERPHAPLAPTHEFHEMFRIGLRRGDEARSQPADSLGHLRAP